MKNKIEKLCLVQPSNDFQVSVHKHALPLTFPYLIKEFSLDKEFQISLYVEDKNNISFSEFIATEKPLIVLITVNTATFPNSIRIARIAKQYNCHVILGGIFATMNAEIITENYSCFDQIIKGFPSKNFFKLLPKQKIIEGRRSYDIDFEIADVLNNPIFKFYKNDPVCYEITFGCAFNCNFCSLRYVWGKGVCSFRNSKTVNNDFKKLGNWDSLKIIDDDILQSQDILKECEIGNNFKKIVAETRIDRINENTILILKKLGVTHLIMGVESFDTNNLNTSSKTKLKNWKEKTHKAIDLCVKYGIIPRPVMQFLFPDMPKSYLTNITPQIKDWTPQNGIEVFFVFFTPHPGIKIRGISSNNLITNDLSKFDHLSPVYKPNGYSNSDVNQILNEFNNLVDITDSLKYNPYIKSTGGFIRDFESFFQ